MYWFIEHYYCSLSIKCSYTAYDHYASLCSLCCIGNRVYHHATFTVKNLNSRMKKGTIEWKLDYNIDTLSTVTDNTALEQRYFPSRSVICQRDVMWRKRKIVMKTEVDWLEYIRGFWYVAPYFCKISLLESLYTPCPNFYLSYEFPKKYSHNFFFNLYNSRHESQILSRCCLLQFYFWLSIDGLRFSFFFISLTLDPIKWTNM